MQHRQFEGSARSAPRSALDRAAAAIAGRLPSLVRPPVLGWRHTFVRPMVVAIAVAGVSFALPKQYRAEASFFPTMPQLGGNLSAIAQTLGIGAMANSQGPDFYADLLQSNSIMEMLAKTPIRTSAGKSVRPVEFFENEEYPESRAVAETVKDLSKHMRVHANKITGVIDFDFSSADSVFTAGVVNQLLAFVNEFNVRSYQSSAHATRVYLEARQKTLKEQLSAAEGALQRFRESNRAISSVEAQTEQARLQRDVSMKEQVYLANAQQLEGAVAEEVRSTPTISIIDRATVPAKPDRPKPLLYGVLVGFLAGVYGLVVAFRAHWPRAGAQASQGNGVTPPDYIEALDLNRPTGAPTR